jgi:hypothetical protein
MVVVVVITVVVAAEVHSRTPRWPLVSHIHKDIIMEMDMQ